MLPSWCQDVVTVLRAPLVDSRGTKVRDWAHATSATVTGCSLQPASTSTDFGEVRQAADADATLYLPPDADVLQDDRIVFGGVTYAVDGIPYEWRSPTGRVTHRQARLKRWSG